MQGVVGGPRGCRGLTERGRIQAENVAYWIAAGARSWGDVAVYSSTLPRAIETAAPIAKMLGVSAGTDCGLCTWHYPGHIDGQPGSELRERFGVPGGGLFRPFQIGNETWSELVTRTSRAIVDLADLHRGQTVVLVAHTETINVAFHALGMLSVYTPFDTVVDHASVTEWLTDDDPTRMPPARWTLKRFNQRIA